jgi:hypothetical protein
MRARMGMLAGVLSAAASVGCQAGSTGEARVVRAPISSPPAEVMTVAAVATTAAPVAPPPPPACPSGATWVADRGRCVIYVPVQRPPAVPLDVAHMPDPCGAGTATSDPGLSGCDPDAMGDRIAPSTDIERGYATAAVQRTDVSACAPPGQTTRKVRVEVTFAADGQARTVTLPAEISGTPVGACVERRLRAVHTDPLRHPPRDHLTVSADLAL